MASTSDYILSGATQDAIIPTTKWARRAREILARGRARKAAEERERERSLAPASIWPGNTFSTEDIAERPDNWLYNALSDESLNRGLGNLLEGAGDVVLGRESGNALVDLGTANIPGVGAASILAAGGMPGLVDVAGLGELRNMKRIPKYTYEFVKEFFGDKGLKNLDNALTMYPKADKPSVNDARYILKSGLGGEKVTAIKPYSSGNAIRDLDMAFGFTPGRLDSRQNILYKTLIKRTENNDYARNLTERAHQLYEEGIENNDISKIGAAHTVLTNLFSISEAGLLNQQVALPRIERFIENVPLIRESFDLSAAKAQNPAAYNNLRRIAELNDSRTQDWVKIVADQKYLDEHPEVVAEAARKAEEAALKSKLAKMSKKERKAYEEKLRRQQQAQQQKQHKKKADTPKQETIATEPVTEHAKPEEVVQSVKETVQGGPNKWRDNGWDPNVRSDAFYKKFGNDLSDNSKRDVYVTDSLANRWARQIRGEGREGSLADAVITDALSRADARHNLSSYDEASRGFYKDLKKNIASGNMPGTAVKFGPKYKNNAPTNRDTPTLVIPLNEHPRADYPTRIWADQQDGPDLYEIVFRPKADDILNSINPDYWLYNNR